MAGPTLGTLLIQRLDAVLGTALSQQTHIVNRTVSDPVTQTSQVARHEQIPGTVVRHAQETVDRITSGTRSGSLVTTRSDVALPATTTDAPQPGHTASATTSLGLAARIILALFANQNMPLHPVTGRTPLIKSAPGTPDAHVSHAVLIRALAHQLQQSGLFYESHLQRLAHGQYPLARIQQEPQAHIPVRHNDSAPPQPASTQHATAPGLDPSTHVLVRQQLEALADQAIHWRGEAWPGAPVNWSIVRHPDHDSDASAHPSVTPSWQSTIDIDLPDLGLVTAHVHLTGTQLSVTVLAEKSAIPILHRHSQELNEHIVSHQLELTALTFTEHHEQHI